MSKGPPSRHLRRPSSVFLKILTAIASFVVALLVAEAAFRLLDIHPQRFKPPRWLSLHEGTFQNLGIWGKGLIKRESRFETEFGIDMGEYVPGTVFKVEYDSNPRGYFDSDNTVLMTVNALGLRGQSLPVTVEKPPGLFRILGLGDSYTFGVGIRDEDTFLRRLENGLNAKAGAGRRFEVLNAGVQGYNTRDEVLYLEKHWLEMGLAPDLVLIVFCLNDAYSDGAFLNMGQTLGVYLNQPAGMAHYSRIWDIAQHKYRVRKVSRQTERYFNDHYFAEAATFLNQPGDFKADWRASRAALEHVARLAPQRNFKVGVVIFPEMHDLDRGYPFTQIHELVREACASLGLPFIDLLDVFEGKTTHELWVHPSDHHPNEKAQVLAAEAIEEFVRREFLQNPGPIK